MNRLELKKSIISKIPDKKSNMCIGDVLRQFKIHGYINSGYFGDVYAMGIGKDTRYTTKSYTTASKTKRKPSFVMKVSYNSKLNMEEVNTLKRISNTLFHKTPHVPLFYKYFKCDNTDFRGYKKHGVAKSYEDWTFVKSGKSLITFMEYVGQSMDKFLKVNKNPYIEYVMLFQLVYTVHVMQQAGMIHGDIHVPNITYMPTGLNNRSSVYWEYKVGHTSFSVPIGEYIPVYIDFGQSVPFNSNNRTPKLNDAVSLMRTWQHHTQHEEIYEFIRDVRRRVHETDEKILSRYVHAANILRDFFPMFLTNDKNIHHNKKWVA